MRINHQLIDENESNNDAFVCLMRKQDKES